MLKADTENTLSATKKKKDCWWALYTRHQHEKSVAEMLAMKECDVFLPLHNVMRRWNNRNMKLSLPLFPGYVFVRARTEWQLRIVTTPGIHMIVGNGRQFAEISNEEIENLKRTVLGAPKVEPYPYLQCGEQAKVTRGPLEGIEGILVRKKNQLRLVLSVETLARSIAVEVDIADVIPVAPRDERMYLPSELTQYVPSTAHYNTLTTDS